MADFPDWTRLFWLYGTSITLPINIESSDVVLGVSIDAVTADLDVTITAAEVTLAINFSDQSVAVWGAAAWFSRQGEQVSYGGFENADDATVTTMSSRTVPSGKTHYIAGFAWGLADNASPTYVYGMLEIKGVAVVMFSSQVGNSVTLDVPMRALAGELVRIRVKHEGTGGTQKCMGSCWGWDEEN